uniref:Uncharacterized protein n=1 Tax=Oryza sativa subsp. japonica TaxID=39947 RepID=Q67UU4_ORYSJ|nr:hypothetical protein [Oryza sativa Japonica Group]
MENGTNIKQVNNEDLTVEQMPESHRRGNEYSHKDETAMEASCQESGLMGRKGFFGPRGGELAKSKSSSFGR